MSRLFLWFVKLTGWPIQFFYFRKQVVLTEGASRRIRGGALIVSNHTSVFDYALLLYVFITRSLRTLTADVIYRKSPFMAFFMRATGAIRVNRESFDFSFLSELEKCLRKGQVGLIFPESRIPTADERADLLPFKPSYVYLALETGVPVIPVWTNGVYGKQKKNGKHAVLVIGKPMDLREFCDSSLSEKENIERINEIVRNTVRSLGAAQEEEKSYERKKADESAGKTV